jgi:hypothetical protein
MNAATIAAIVREFSSVVALRISIAERLIDLLLQGVRLEI